MLHPGLYEQVVNNALNSELAEIPEARKALAPIDQAEASKVLAQYLYDVVQRGLENVLDNGGDLSAQVELVNQIVDLIQNTTEEADFAALGVDRQAEQLLALLRDADPRLAVGKTAADLSRPESSILGTADYVKHEGSRPMNITWKLDRPIPAKFLKKTNKLVVG